MRRESDQLSIIINHCDNTHCVPLEHEYAVIFMFYTIFTNALFIAYNLGGHTRINTTAL